MNRKAFTLIELLVVVAIIGILAAVGVVAYNGYTKSAKSATVKSTCKNVEKFIRLEAKKCSLGFTEYIFGQKNSNFYRCPLSDPQYGQEGRIARMAFGNYVGYSGCSFCKMKNPFKTEKSLMVFNNWGALVDSLLGYVFVSDNNSGIDIFCCHSTPCNNSANYNRVNIIP